MSVRSIILLTTIIISNSASAAMLYSDRDLFNQSVGASIVDGYDSETYGWNPDDPYGSVRLTDEDLNSLSPEVVYSTEHGINYVGYAYTYQTDPGVFCSGCNLAFTMDFTGTSIGSSSGIYGMGLDIVYNSASDPYITEIRHAYVTFGDGSMIDYALPKIGVAAAGVFWGITSDELITSITFDDPESYIATTSLMIDNLTIATSPVPVPAAVWLFGSGLIGIIGIARRKKT